QQRFQELLLVPLAAVVAVGDQLALPYVVQRLPAGHVLAAGLVHLRPHTPDRHRVVVRRDQVVRRGFLAVGGPADVHRGGLLVDAQVDPADRVDDRLEPGEVDDRGRVEAQSGQLLQRQPDQFGAAGAAAAVVEPVGVRGVYLVGAAVVTGLRVRRDLHAAVPRDRHQVHAIVRGRDVRDEDGVRARTVDRVTGPVVTAEQQDVERPVDRCRRGRGTGGTRGGGGRATEQRGLVHAAGEAAQEKAGHAGGTRAQHHHDYPDHEQR